MAQTPIYTFPAVNRDGTNTSTLKEWSIKLIVDNIDVSAYVQNVQWSGDIDQAARSLKVSLERGCQPEVGDTIAFYCNKILLFSGIVLNVSLNGKDVSVDAMDYGVYLANNYTYKEYSGTPQSITKKVCEEFHIDIGKLAEVKTDTKVTSTGNLSAFQVIEQAYEGEEKDPKKQYVLRMKGKTLSVEKIGGDVVADIQAEIQSANRSEDIKNMVNRVVILNDEGTKKTGEVENAKDRSKYGTFQKTYRKEKDKNAETEAKKLLEGIQEQGSISALGDMNCLAGRTVQVTEAKTGLKGKYIIKSDQHTFSATGHDMQLDFYFES